MKKTFLVILLIIMFSLLVFTPNTIFSYEIKIVGSSKYKKQVVNALNLLEKKSPESYKTVCTYVGIIEQNRKSGMAAYKNPPTYKMSNKTAFYSLTWCASTIAHDSFHSKLYHDYKENYGAPVPYNVWGGFEAERKCIKHQLKTLRDINAPKHEIKYCLTLDGTHGDVNKDGKLDKKDYELRDW